jgi:hypothetical protein
MEIISLQGNPFAVWAELACGLRDRLVSELGDERPFRPYAGELVGELAAIITRCQHLGVALQHLFEHDPKAYDAFLRALERS